jgi:hypothetical protein
MCPQVCSTFMSSAFSSPISSWPSPDTSTLAISALAWAAPEELFSQSWNRLNTFLRSMGGPAKPPDAQHEGAYAHGTWATSAAHSGYVARNGQLPVGLRQ